MRALVDHVLDVLPYGPATALLLVQNLVVFALAVGLGGVLARRFRARPVCAPPPPLERREVLYAATTIVLNTVVTVAGLWLYRAGVVRFRRDVGLRALLDVLVLLLVMDAAMYALHRLAHVEPFYRLLHRLHHRYERPRPLTLFVLSPPETLAFGALWLLVITVYPASWLGMSIYLVLNVVFGAVGHLGVEPLPAGWIRAPAVRHVATSSFHAQHHHDRAHNFGFYTLVWDRLFGTLSPTHDRDFGRLPPVTEGGAAPPTSRSTAAPPRR